MPRNATDYLNADKLREFARAGAEVTLNRLRGEITAIERAFPELATPAGRRATARTVRTSTQRARRMSASARKAVSERMKRYWAERRKAKVQSRKK
jgi:hypothetical protein